MIDFAKELNEEQLKVVTEADGHCLVLAGAGSGKTRAITYRVAYLLEKGIRPENILLVTFTNKAAREMLQRVQDLTNGEVSLPWSGTFHHIAFRVLKKYASFLDYPNNFTVLDADDSLELVKQALKDEGIDRKEKRFPSPAVLQSIISYARNAEMTIEEVLDQKHPRFLDIADTINRLAKSYEEKKKKSGVMDFDDLLFNWLRLLQESEKIRIKHQEQFEYILVDEYQDTNKMQASIIRLIAKGHNNLLVVGDDAQSIYSFRAAEIKNILDFEKEYSGAKIFRLEINYRSTPEILDVANNVISNNVKQYKKELKSVVKSFAKPEVKAFANPAEEADFVVDRIEELLGEGIHPEKIAVLFRAARHSQALEMGLMKNGITYDYRGGIRFFERSHVKDVLAYLKIINNPSDEIAWRRVLRMQVGIGEVTIDNILQNLKISNFQFPISNLPARAQVGWNDFLQVFNKLKDVSEIKIGDLIRIIIESKYAEYLENEFPDYRERIEDLEQMALFANKAPDLSTFLAESALQENFRALAVETRHASSLQGKIVLSTVHQAKGLEWEAVFIINVSNGQFPNDRSFKEDGGLEEERRLFYVAITRAKKYLHLTYSMAGGFGDFQGGPSLFLEELDFDLVDREKTGSVFDDFADSDEVVYVSEDEPLKKRTGFLRDIDEL